MSEAVRVVLCDDHPVVLAGLRALLDSAGDLDVVGEAASGDEVLAVARRERPDVVLMDLQLSSGSGTTDGIQATRRLTAEPGGPRVLVLTTYDTDADVSRAIEAGATGYLLKAGRPEDLFDAIRAAARGQSMLSPQIASRVVTRMRQPAPTLTERETQVLRRLADGLSNRQIADQLFISPTTVKTHVAHIYEKLGVDTRAAAVAVASERRLIGY